VLIVAPLIARRPGYLVARKKTKKTIKPHATQPRDA
jgi:hypothetical protein